MVRVDRRSGGVACVEAVVVAAGAGGTVPLVSTSVAVSAGGSFNSVGVLFSVEAVAGVVVLLLAPSGAVVSSEVDVEDCSCGAAIDGGRTIVSGVGGSVGSDTCWLVVK